MRRLLRAKVAMPVGMEGDALRRSPHQHADLLHALGAIAVRHGNPLRGLALIYAASKLAPDDRQIAISLAHAYLVNDESELALGTLDNLKELQGDQHRWAVAYLKAKSLLAAGHVHEAQDVFSRDVVPFMHAAP